MDWAGAQQRQRQEEEEGNNAILVTHNEKRQLHSTTAAICPKYKLLAALLTCIQMNGGKEHLICIRLVEPGLVAGGGHRSPRGRERQVLYVGTGVVAKKSKTKQMVIL
jgi:hypothetical protein